MTYGTFECGKCHNIFGRTISPEDSKVRFEENFPGREYDKTPTKEVCEICFQDLMYLKTDDGPVKIQGFA